MKHYRFASLITLALIQPCLATSTLSANNTQLDEIVVTGTRLPQKLSESLSDITVITHQDIEAAGQDTLVELLQTLGGIEISSTGGMGQPSGVFIRGANSNHTLVLLDGMRINSATTGTTALENIPLAQIERIEILKGPSSSLYGSDAIGGVIQIFTRKGTGAPKLNAEAGIGSYNTQTIGAGLSGTLHDTDFALHVSRTHTEGFSATTSNLPFQFNPDRDSYLNTNLSGKLSYQFNQDNEAGLTLFYSNGETRFDSGLTTDDITQQELSAFSLFSRNRITTFWQSQIRLSNSLDNSDTQGSYPGVFRTNQQQATWLNDFTVPHGKIILGLEQLNQHVASDTIYTQHERKIHSALIGYSGNFDRHELQLNLRDDNNEQFGTHTSGSASYGYYFAPQWKAVASIGTAFKAPSFNDLYYHSTFFDGYPNLLPERSREIETGIHYDHGPHHASAIYFNNHIHDLITVNDSFTSMTNLSSAEIRGIELNYSGDIYNFKPHASLTFQSPVNGDTGQLLPRRAREHANLGISKTVNRWQFGAEAILSGHRYDSATNSSTNLMGGYSIFNLSAAFTLNKNTTLRAHWNNIFDKDYELAYGYNTPKENVFVSIEYRPQ